jgi:two-component system response regulator MprA
MTDINAAKILIAEDDRSVRQSLQRALRYEGYDISLAVDGAEALESIKDDRPDALILDIMMPYVDGLSVCRRVRSKGDDLPILMLTAKHEISDRVAGLDAGADDYLVKPFALEELLARLRALLRRTAPEDVGGPLTFADLSLDPETRQVERSGRPIELTKTEFDLLEILMLNSGIVLTREVIYERIWGYDFGTSSNSLDVYIGYLRRKTETEGETRLIYTVRGVGYALRES